MLSTRRRFSGFTSIFGDGSTHLEDIRGDVDDVDGLEFLGVDKGASGSAHAVADEQRAARTRMQGDGQVDKEFHVPK